MLTVLEILVGLMLLFSGRRLYWVLVAAAGFVTGLALAPLLLPGQPDWVVLVTALLLAVAGTVLAVMAQKLVIAAIGFLAGGGVALLLLRVFALRGEVLGWIAYLVGGVVGLVLVLGLFEWGLILLSSLAGSILIVDGVEKSVVLSQAPAFWVIVVIALIGVLAQANWLGARPRYRRPGA